MDQNVIQLATGDELGKLSYGTGEVPFIRTSDLSNWEIKVDPKHTVDESIYRRYAKKQDVRPLDILMVRDGTYLIGTCAIVMPGEEKTSIQSHIYKIRVEQLTSRITPFLLLAIFELTHSAAANSSEEIHAGHNQLSRRPHPRTGVTCPKIGLCLRRNIYSCRAIDWFAARSPQTGARCPRENRIDHNRAQASKELALLRLSPHLNGVQQRQRLGQV